MIFFCQGGKGEIMTVGTERAISEANMVGAFDLAYIDVSKPST